MIYSRARNYLYAPQEKRRESEFPPTTVVKQSGIGIPSYNGREAVGNRNSLLQRSRSSRESEFPPTTVVKQGQAFQNVNLFSDFTIRGMTKAKHCSSYHRFDVYLGVNYCYSHPVCAISRTKHQADLRLRSLVVHLLFPPLTHPIFG